MKKIITFSLVLLLLLITSSNIALGANLPKRNLTTNSTISSRYCKNSTSCSNKNNVRLKNLSPNQSNLKFDTGSFEQVHCQYYGNNTRLNNCSKDYCINHNHRSYNHKHHGYYN